MGFKVFAYDFLSWYYRGADFKHFVSHLFDLINVHQSDIFILYETRPNSSSVNSFIHRFIFTDFIAAEARGFAGGI